jgi:hypothetical protein
MEDCFVNRDPRGEIGPPTVVTDSVKVSILTYIILFFQIREFCSGAYSLD